MIYSAVAISVKTGRPIKKPKKGQTVRYAVRGPKGRLTILREEPQKFFKTDLLGLNKAVAFAKKNNFIIYEQKLRTLKKVKGKVQYRTDKKGARHKIHETKITFAKPRSKTKPLLYVGGKKLRALDLAYRKGNYQKQKYIRQLTLIKPDAKMYTQVLTGRTIVSALENIQLNITQKQKKGFGVYYNIMVMIQTPTGEVIKVPVNSSFYDKEFQGSNRFMVDGKMELFGESRIKLLANLQNNMAKSIRYAFKNTGDGYTFSSLAVLEQIVEREDKKMKIAAARGDNKEANRISKAINGIWFGGKKRRFFINPRTKLIDIDSRYKVTMYVKFEKFYD